MFGVVRNWRRKRWAKRPTPALWHDYLAAHVPFVEHLEPQIRARFFRYLKIFVWEKYFFGAKGLEVSEEMKVVIGATAVRLVLHLDISEYDRLTEVIIYPNHYHHEDKEGIVFGEAHEWGTVVLSWEAVLHGLSNPHDGHDTATHEFAHVLDRASGAYNGTPDLRAREHYRPWAQVMTKNFFALQEGERKQERVLRDYGAINEAEFFAVATEAFFEKPQQMLKHTPDLYQELKRFYGFDPIE
jgi:Mlc titration factor MtfA (ptsG expression regulator)